jgi:hypothetical protein
MKKICLSWLLFLNCLTLFAQQADPQVLHDWVDEYRKSIKKHKTVPPVAARIFGYLGVIWWESTYSFIPLSSSLRGQINAWDFRPVGIDFKKMHPEVVANRAAAQLAAHFFPSDTVRIRACEGIYLAKFRQKGISPVVVEASATFGTQFAQELIKWAIHDGYTGDWFPNSYQWEKAPGKWQPLPGQKALLPYWGLMRSFIPGSADKTQLEPPIEYSSDSRSDFFQQMLRVYLVSREGNIEYNIIARYWSDDPGEGGTPPGHSMSIVKQVLQGQNADWATCIEAYARCGIAVSDAFISCWKTKYKYNYERPVTAIKRLIDPKWEPLLGTPPFPEYPSGHSVQVGAMAEVLTQMFGDNVIFTDRTHENRSDINGKPRGYVSFNMMAEEAALSRLYGGIHYWQACLEGLEQGKKNWPTGGQTEDAAQ